MANLISSSVSIGSSNKHQLAEMLLTACNYNNYKVPQDMFKNVPYDKKNAGEPFAER